MTIVEHPMAWARLNNPVDPRGALLAQARATVAAHAKDVVFRIAPETTRLAEAYPGAGMNRREIADLLMAEAVARRLAVDTGSFADE